MTEDNWTDNDTAAVEEWLDRKKPHIHVDVESSPGFLRNHVDVRSSHHVQDPLTDDDQAAILAMVQKSLGSSGGWTRRVVDNGDGTFTHIFSKGDQAPVPYWEEGTMGEALEEVGHQLDELKAAVDGHWMTRLTWWMVVQLNGLKESWPIWLGILAWLATFIILDILHRWLTGEWLVHP